MRTLMRVSIPVEAGNNAIRQGGLERVVNDTMNRLRPEAAYFTTEKGNRTCYMVFDLKDVSDMPMISEPFFMELNASVDWSPVMNKDDLKRGLESLMAHQGQGQGMRRG
jgi:hypothetical protein